VGAVEKRILGAKKKPGHYGSVYHQKIEKKRDSGAVLGTLVEVVKRGGS